MKLPDNFKNQLTEISENISDYCVISGEKFYNGSPIFFPLLRLTLLLLFSSPYFCVTGSTKQGGGAGQCFISATYNPGLNPAYKYVIRHSPEFVSQFVIK